MTRAGAPKSTGLSGPLRVAPKTPAVETSSEAVALKAPSAPTKLPNSAHLEAEIARRQLRLVDAQQYVSQGLAEVALVPTSAELENALGAALAKIARGGQVRADAVFRAATAGQGERVLAQLPRVFESHRNAIRQDLPQKERAAFDKKAAGLFERIAGQALKSLGQTKPPDRKAAFESMRAASEQLNGIRTPITYMYNSFHAYTNESGLWPLLKSLPPNDGATLGVGGAVLEVAAQRRSSMVVLTDVQPELRLFLLAVTGVLLTVDQKAEDGGWDDKRRCDEVRARLGQGHEGRGWQRPMETMEQPLAKTVDEIGLLGIEQDVLPGLLAALEGAEGSHGQAGWLTDDDSILHLMQLALQGRIVATTTDIGDPALAGRLQTLFEAHKVALGTFHLSNALDYTADAASPTRILQSLPIQEGAVLTSSSDFEYIGILGSFAEPKATPVTQWLKPDGAAAELQDSSYRQRKLDTLYKSLNRDMEIVGVALPKKVPQTIEAYEKIRARAEAKALANPKTALAWAERELSRRRGLADDPVGMMIARLSAPKQQALCHPVPSSAEAFSERLELAAHRYWTPKAKRALVKDTLRSTWVHVPETDREELNRVVARLQPSLVRFVAERTLRRAQANQPKKKNVLGPFGSGRQKA